MGFGNSFANEDTDDGDNGNKRGKGSVKRGKYYQFNIVNIQLNHRGIRVCKYFTDSYVEMVYLDHG